MNNVFKTRSTSALAVLSAFEISFFSDLRVGLKNKTFTCVSSWMYSMTKCGKSGIKAVYNYTNEDFFVT